MIIGSSGRMKWLLGASIWAVYCIILSILSFFGTISLSEFVVFFLLPFVVAIIIKVIKECKEYGKENVFCFAKKGSLADRRDIFLKSLESQLNSQVFIADKNPNMIVIVNTNGIYLYFFLQEIGTLYEKDNIWFIKDGQEEREISTPFIELDQEQKFLEDVLGNPIYGCVVLDTYTYLQKGIKKYRMLSVENAPFYLCRTDLLKQLSEEEYEKVIEKLKIKTAYKKAFQKGEGEIIC